MKINKVTPLFKNVDRENITHYNPVAVPPCLQIFMRKKLLYSKKFVFQKVHSTYHAIVHVVDQIYESFESDKYTLGIFINLSETFDTVDNSILLKKPRNVRCQYYDLTWLASYLKGT